MEPWEYRPAQDLGLSRAERLRSVRREVGLAGWLLSRLAWALIRAYLRLRHRLRIEGRENLPEATPFVMIANHASHFDAITLCAALPAQQRVSAFPIAAGDTFFETDAAATFATIVMNALPLWRRRCGAHALDALRTRLVEDACVFVLFPEGTRARDGRLGTFKAGIGRLVAGTSIAVVPCYIDGAHTAWPPDRRFPGPGRLRVSIGRPLSFEQTENRRAGWESIATELRQAVEACARRT